MFKTMRSHINYANVTATLALFFAMSGGALAAKHYLLSSTKQISPKVLKALKGNAGATGATGQQGKEGAAGKEGSPGKEGKEGRQGKEGARGETGQSALTPLQSGQTERGVIGLSTVVGDSEKVASGLEAAFASLPIPAPVALDNSHVLVAGVTDSGECTGSYESPTAPGGDVCIYVNFTLNATSLGGFVPDGRPTPYGFGIHWGASASGSNSFVEGDWAYKAA